MIVADESFTPVERLEVCAVASGTKNIARLVRQAEARVTLETLVGELKLRVVESGFRMQQRWTTLVEDEFVSLVPGPPANGERTVFYLVRPGEEVCVEMLRRMEVDQATGESIGAALGYPACCSAAYCNLVERRGDWIRSMLEATPKEINGLSACNRMARLFGDWTVLPDYFPCSFACKESQGWAERITAGVLSLGGEQAEQLRQYLDRAWNVVRRPIRIDRDSLLQLGCPIRMVNLPGEMRGQERILYWT